MSKNWDDWHEPWRAAAEAKIPANVERALASQVGRKFDERGWQDIDKITKRTILKTLEQEKRSWEEGLADAKAMANQARQERLHARNARRATLEAIAVGVAEEAKEEAIAVGDAEDAKEEAIAVGDAEDAKEEL